MKLIPQPQEMTLGDGSFRLNYSDRITMDASCPAGVYDAACLLAGEVRKLTGFDVQIDRRFRGGHRGIRLSVNPDLENGADGQGYTLEITESGIVLTGAGEVGVQNGVQTLRQMLRQKGCCLPCLSIADYPDLPVRGLFYDVTRCRIPTMEFMKALADKCSYYKMNQLHLYIEHTYLFDGLSEVWRDDTPLTAADILELDAYCRKRHIDLVPSVASLGHLYKVLRTRTYHHLSEIDEAGDAAFSFHHRMGHHTLDVTQEDSLKLVFGMIDEYAALFTSKLFNINGDEPFDLGRGRGQERAAEVGSHQMYVDWLGKVSRHVEELGRIPMFWGDVIVADPESVSALPDDIICMTWNYATNPYEKDVENMAKTGVKQYLCPGAQGWKQTINLFDAAYLNISRMAHFAGKYNAEGLLVTEWGDYGHLQDPESSYPGILYSAAMGWNHNIPTEEAINEAISVVEYGDPTGKIMSVLRTLSQQVVMSWGMLVEFAELQTHRLLDRTMDNFHKEFRDILTDRLPRTGEMEAAIDRCQEEISRLMPAMTERSRMYPYFLLSDGQKLLNRFAAQIYGEAGPDAALAVELETWYNDYKNLWRRSSRESELYRLGEVVFFAADYLRRDK